MQLISAKFKNFRALASTEIKFSTRQDKALTIIRAEPNGGKTTIFEGLQWILWGVKGLKTTPNELMRLHHWNLESIEQKIKVEGRLVYKDEDDTTFTIIRAQDVSIKKVNYFNKDYQGVAQVLRHTADGHEPIKGPQSHIDMAFNSNKKNIGFMDGDEALRFIDKNYSVAERKKNVSDAVKEMLGIGIVDKALGHVKSARNSAAPKASQKTLPIDAEIGELQDKLETLTKKSEALNDKIEKGTETKNVLQSKLEKLKGQIFDGTQVGKPGELKAKSASLEADLKDTRDKQASYQKEYSRLFTKISLAIPIMAKQIEIANTKIEELKDKGDIPQESIPFLKARLNKGICICGEPLLETGCHHSEYIQESIYSAQESGAVDSRLITLGINSSSWLNSKEIHKEDWLQDHKNVHMTRSDAAGRIDSLEKELKDIQNTIKTQAEGNLEDLITYESQALDEVDKIKADIQEWSFDRNQTDKGIADTNSELTKVMGKEKAHAAALARFNAANDLITLLEGTKSDITNVIIPNVSTRMNERFIKMIGTDEETGLYKRAWISRLKAKPIRLSRQAQ
jgi:DNA sulfur modification protein DndD